MDSKKKHGSIVTSITVEGAREHNLRNISVTIPKHALTVITGPSGSGKSSLALDILYTEGKRRYMESLSSYARQFLGIAKKPEFDRIEGLCPAIAIEQKTVGHNPRSTVGTITEIYDYLRVLFARVGLVHCPECKRPITAQSSESIADLIRKEYSQKEITVIAPFAVAKKGEFVADLLGLFARGYYRVSIDGTLYRFKSEDEIKAIKLKKTFKHTIDVVIDRCTVSPEEHSRLVESIDASFALAKGMCKVIVEDTEHLYSSDQMCVHCNLAVPEIEPRFFSFNSPIGACKDCNGLGIRLEWPWEDTDPEAWKMKYPDFFGRYAQEITCLTCMGRRLNTCALAVTVGGASIYDISMLSLNDAYTFFTTLTLEEKQQEIASSLLHEISERLRFLKNVGLSYLSLSRTARTLSGGEGQRIRLATQIGCALSGVLYILDEPSIGLHQRDNDRLIETLKTLRDQGNTVVVVEHDIDTISQADYVIDMGPGAGILGGLITAVGTPEELAANEHSLTGAYLSGRRAINVPEKRRKPTSYLSLLHARKNNLKDVSVKFPLGVLTCITGVSGSGKSTLVLDELVTAIQQEFQGGKRTASSKSYDLEGLDKIDSLVVIDQAPIGRTPRSNPATYLGIFDEVRKIFAALPESNARGYKVGRFTFNVKEGRCFECNGEGTISVSMQFLADVVMTCKVCKGKRYNKETLQIMYKGKSIADVLDMSAREAVEFFAAHKNIQKRLQLLCDVGLDYLTLGQSSITLSGGEAQRIKLVDELAKRGSNTLYILDEPTTGLHSSDIERLLVVLTRLIDKGNSMIVIEHNLDVIKTADHVIDMGPEGGDEGGYVIAEGTPEQVAKNAKSHTGHYLKRMLAA